MVSKIYTISGNGRRELLKRVEERFFLPRANAYIIDNREYLCDRYYYNVNVGEVEIEVYCIE